MKKLSLPQKRALTNMLAGREPGFGLKGQAAHGGFAKTFAWLLRNGYVTTYHYEARLTDEGRKVAREAGL